MKGMECKTVNYVADIGTECNQRVSDRQLSVGAVNSSFLPFPVYLPPPYQLKAFLRRIIRTRNTYL